MTAGLDDSERERVQRAVVVMNELFGADDRLRRLCEDVVTHWDIRAGEMRKFIGVRGKGMIVCCDAGDLREAVRTNYRDKA